MTREEIAKFVERAMELEREACAAICEQTAKVYRAREWPSHAQTAEKLAQAIRDRGRDDS